MPSTTQLQAMNDEWRNVLRCCSRPAFAIGLMMFLHKQAVARLYSKLTPRVWQYPMEVRTALRHMERDGVGAHAGSRPYEATEACPGLPGGCDLKLAHGRLAWNGSLSWKTMFADAEQTVSLHRWNWLLCRLAEEPFAEIRTWGLQLMRDWIKVMDSPKTGLPWESYTAGERICNAVLFLAFTGEKPYGLSCLPEDLGRALRGTAEFLVHRLEYHGPERTGNHVINNARALYFAGQALGIAAYTHIAIAIFRNDLPRIVKLDGFLREGSSHYHFLVTRWLLEVLWVAGATGEREIRAIIEPIATAMVERCWFFLVFQGRTRNWVMPLIGDVSPDCTWQWLLDLPWSSWARRLYAPSLLPHRPRAEGWGCLVEGRRKQAEDLPFPEEHKEPRFQSHPESGWYRLEWGPVVIFWHVEPEGAPAFVSHGHCDIGSFCFYWDGLEILVDPGRLNYQEDDPLGTYGVSARAHNSVLIDGFEPFIYRYRGRYPDSYRKGTAKVSWTCEEEEFRLSVQYTGFWRLHGDRIVFNRTFKVRDGRFVIEDHIEGGGSHLITTNFQWAPQIALLEEGRTERFSVMSNAEQFRGTFSTEQVEPRGQATELESHIVRGCTTPNPGGWYFPEYGEKIGASSLMYECKVKLPYARRYVLQWRT